MLIAVLLSVGLHAALLLPVSSGRLAGKPADSNLETSPLLLRVVQPALGSDPVPVPVPEPEHVLASNAVTTAESTSDPLPSPGIEPAAPVEPEVSPPAAVETKGDDAFTPVGAPAGNDGQALFGPRYYSAHELTTKPVFMHDNGAPAPTFIPDVFPLPVVVSVYINEQGTVDDVVLGESFLSDVAKKFIFDSFIAMQFTPGLIGTLPVRSMLVTEVKLNPALPTR